MTAPFQNDLKVSLPQNTLEKATLFLSPTGDIQIVEGREKLAGQLTRAIVNDNTSLRSLLNNKSSSMNKNILALLTTILRSFRQTSIDETKKTNVNFSGFKIYRRAAGLNEAYVGVSADPITWRFINTGLTNGTTYEYGVTRIERNIFESAFIDKFSITPTRFSGRKTVIVGSQVAVESGDQQVTIYVDYNRRFKASELLDKVESITIDQSEVDPRMFSVNVIIKDLLENNLSLAVQSISAVTGN